MENEKSEGEIQIDLSRIFSFILRSWWIVLICLVIGAAAGYCCAIFKKQDTYSTSATYVVYYDGGGTLNEQASEQTKVASILGGCVTFARQNRFYKAVAAEMVNGGYENITSDTIASSITFSYSTTAGNFVYVTSKASSPDLAYDILIAVTNIFEDYIKTNYHMAGDSSIVFSLANDITVPTTPVSDISITKYTIIGGLGLAVLCVVVLAIIVIADQRVKGEDDLVNRYGIAVLGAIPNFEDKDLVKRGYYEEKAKN